MKRALILLALTAGLATGGEAQTTTSQQAEPREFQMKEGDTTYTMRRYVMVLLYLGKKANKIPKDALAKLQDGHMSNINRMFQDGKLLVAGPMGDDSKLRGIFILDTETIEEARALVEADPSVKAGRLRAEYHPWWTAKGTIIR